MASAMPDMQFVIPGPDTANIIPGRPVKYPTAPAAYEAAYSFLKPKYLTP